ncbi:YigZ family protein [Mycoplasmopsis columbinasalis]|uniref:Proline dipeptidase pepQ n=1 Tax=Mycoplasmopsis columbinasalis TaxID=114880 RepID=A0A449BAV9_9BACT|nr:YigZ family protein [Mycoplasmopsis columbinasalis]VEU78333.1 proline dipeptidase pepQ [Mycoplasmopsis columbinasalis]
MFEKTGYYEIKKSKFYSYATTLTQKEEVAQLFAYLKKEHKKARHICYGYILVDGQNLHSQGYDDGEPSGTGGKAIRELLFVKNIRNKIVFVIRYFGGIKLGWEGVKKAYKEAAKLVLD